MDIAYFSDIHSDRYQGNREIFSNKKDNDVLIIAGDTCDGFNTRRLDAIIKLAESFNISFYVPGNHEYYHNDIDELNFKLAEYFKDTNIMFLNKNVAYYKDQRFIGCTLWSDIFVEQEAAIAGALNDFDVIKNMSTARWKELHTEHLTWLKSHMKKDDIIITHHAPTYKVRRNANATMIDSAFCTSLESLCYEPNAPKAWFFGHCHNIWSEIINNTRFYINVPKDGRDGWFKYATT